MNFENQELHWHDYYETVGVSSWLDFAASIIYNERYFLQIIKTKPYSVLEVGTGRGLHAIALSHIVPKVVGIDADECLVEKAPVLNEKFKGRAVFARMDAFHLGFGKNSFSVCCSQGFFEHFEDSEITDLLDEQLRVAPQVIFSVPSYYYTQKNFGNERLIKLEEWLRIMGRYVVEAFYYGPTIDTSKGLLGNMKPNTLMRLFSAPIKAHICFKVRKK
jgi:ubiquinone/menaquinone biosynthesis C-methylase UbiE